MILFTNDDGIDAPGLAALCQSGESGGDGVVIAPATHQSGVSHRVTVWDESIRVNKRENGAFAVHGTPADCVRLGLTHLLPQTTWVLSGINEGGNLGADLYMSGTVAAAREAAFLGMSAIAVSQYIKKRGPLDWGQASRWTTEVLRDLMGRARIPRTFWNVNLPHLESESAMPEVVFCEPCRQPMPMEYDIDGEHYRYTGVYGNRVSDTGADVEVCFSGKIAVSLIHL
ncbi:MAG: 5'/3'-nucleotidase SurE [Candidatus Hydrogenedentota bacterium]|nr:MAG: 5'/3'-nucleotidase SurE [Candidatus Hydrogenedentota bacterium]